MYGNVFWGGGRVRAWRNDSLFWGGFIPGHLRLSPLSVHLNPPGPQENPDSEDSPSEFLI